MEKDYFLDRSKDCVKINSVKMGDEVYICEKHMQKTATELKDLTRGTVLRKLSRGDHPRGIKLEIVLDDYSNAIGRLIYIVKDNELEK